MLFIALLKGVNVGGNKRVPMSDLCQLASRAGFQEVRHYINSGNLIFNSPKWGAEEAAETLEKAIIKKFGFSVDVVIRTASQWRDYVKGNPFKSGAGNLVHLGLSRLPLDSKAVETLNTRAAHGERIRLVKGALWIDFKAGVSPSKLTPAFFEKAAGSPVTLRNYQTVLNLDKMITELLPS